MEQGVVNALSEITLVVFTTFGPAGACAFVMVSLFAVFGKVPSDVRTRLNRYLIAPVLIAMVGLVASATHLGTPANALYVLTGIGRSPLSNEVGAAVLFLALSASLWFSSFFAKEYAVFRKILAGFAVTAALLFIHAVAIVYSVITIPTWASVYAPFNQWMLALILGSFIALLTLYWAGCGECRRFEIITLAISAAALLLSLVSFMLQSMELSGITNSWTSADELMPVYGLVIGIYAAAELIAIVLVAPIKVIRSHISRFPFVACTISAFGVFVMRFSFYMMHMTIGF